MFPNIPPVPSTPSIPVPKNINNTSPGSPGDPGDAGSSKSTSKKDQNPSKYAADLIDAGNQAIRTLSKYGVRIPKPVAVANEAAKVAKEVIANPEVPAAQNVVCNYGVKAAFAAAEGYLAKKAVDMGGRGRLPRPVEGAMLVGAIKGSDQLLAPAKEAAQKKCHAAADALRENVAQFEKFLNQAKQQPSVAPVRSPDQRDRIVDKTVQEFIKKRMEFSGHNPYFTSIQKPFGHTNLHSWLNNIKQFSPAQQPTQPSFLQIRSEIRSLMSYSRSESISSLCSRVVSRLGGNVSTLAVRSELSSCHDILTLPGGYAIHSSAFENIKTRAFAGLLGTTGLSGSYNSYHTEFMNAWLDSFGMIGGVAQKVAVIEGSDIGDFKEHVIALKMDQMPFTSAELQQISKELYDGIFIHNSYPFFSLDFNTEGSLFPLMHPCYERTLVGRVVGFLDAHLKGFLNGGLFSDDLLQNWHLTGNRDVKSLKVHLQDLKKLLPEYRSPREMLCLMESILTIDKASPFHDFAHLPTRNSFRIIAHSGKVARHENVFLIDPDFTVEYTIELTPKCEEYVKSYRAKHGQNPPEYRQLHEAYQHFADTLKKQMPTLPGMDRYFRMLGVINFLCYYYHTLKLSHRAPLLPSTTYSFPAFPKCLPPLPVRYYQQHKLDFTIRMLIDELAPFKEEMNTFLFQQFWHEEDTEITRIVEQACYEAVESLLKRQITQGDLDPKNVRYLAEQCLAYFMNSVMPIGEHIFQSALSATNQSLLSAIRKKGEEDKPVPALYDRIKLKEEELALQENSSKWTFIEQEIDRAVELIREYLQEEAKANYQKALAELPARVHSEVAKRHQEILKEHGYKLLDLKTELLDQAFSITLKAHTMSDWLLENPKIAEQSVIKQDYLHSALEIPTTARDDMRIVGGCGMDLKRITPTSLGSGSRFVRASQGFSHNVFQQFKVAGESYVGFKMTTKPFVLEESDSKGQAETELIQSQGYTPLMIAALRGDEASLHVSLRKGEDPDVRLPSGMDALMLAIQNGEEQLALTLLKSNKIKNINRPLENGMTPLHLAVQLNLPKVARELIQRGAQLTAPRKMDDYTPLHLVAHFGDQPLIAELLPLMKARGVNINLALPCSGKTPLHLAVERGIDPTFLIQAGVNCDAQDKEGNTPLHCAILAGEHQIALMLTEKTSRVSRGIQNALGETSYLLASRYGMFDIANKLDSLETVFFDFWGWKWDNKNRGFNYYAARHGYVEFLDSYVLRGDIEELLKISAQHGHGLFFSALAKIRSKPFKVDQAQFSDLAALDDAGCLGKYVKDNLPRYKFPLSFFLGAIERGNRSLLPLFPFGPQTNQKALLSALKGGNAPYFALVWQEMEKRGFNPKQLSKDLAHEAVRYGRVEILQQLYRFGLPMTLVNAEGITPRQLAKQLDDQECVTLFEKHGVPLPSSSSTATKISPQKTSDALIQKMKQLLRVPRLKQWTDWVRTVDVTMLFDGRPLLHHLLALDPDMHGHFAKQAILDLAKSKYNPLLQGEKANPLSFVLLACIKEEDFKTKLGWFQEAFPQHFAQLLAQTDENGLNLCDTMVLTGSSKLLKALYRKVPPERALHYAAMSGDLEMVNHLIDSEVPCECFDEKIYQPLHYAAQYGHAEVVEALLTHRVNPCLGDRDQNTPLHLAIVNKHVETAQCLIDFMPNPDRPNREGLTPLMLAAIQGCIPLIERLIPYSNPYAVDAQGRNALHLAALHGTLEGVKALIRFKKLHVGTSQVHKGQESGYTALYFAALKGHLKLFRFLISQGAEIHRVGTSGTTILDGMVKSNSPLMHAELSLLPEFYQADYQKSLPATAAQCNNLAVLRELYLMGVPLDHFDAHGMTPLHYAVIHEHHAIVHFLLEHGVPADLSTACKLRQMPLDLAKTESMKQVITPFLNLAVLPAMPTPQAVSAASQGQGAIPTSFKQADPTPHYFREGLKPQECALIEADADKSVCLALAARVKKELGIRELYAILSKQKSSHDVHSLNERRIQMMTLALEIGDFTKLIEPLSGSTLEGTLDLLQQVYQEKMTERQLARYPSQIAKRFSQKEGFVDAPLSTAETGTLAVLYQRLLGFVPACRQKSQQDLAKLARATQDPLESLAAVVETLTRILKISPYDTQLFTLLALIQPVPGCKGRMGQIQTGEGKSTIIAMLAAYFAVRGRKVDIVTTTHSLGKRDQEKYKSFYTAMGITSSHICTQQPEKREFNGEVLYGTNSDFEFALLRQEVYDDQARYALGDCRPQDVVIIDEVDSLFLDLALSEAHLAEEVPNLDISWLYKPYLEWIRSHKHYDFEAIKAHLYNEDGEESGKHMLSDEELRVLFTKGKEALALTANVDYVVQQEKICIVDYQNTGSLHGGSRWSKGLHEFLEAKHGLPVRASSIRLASVSHVAFFRQYKTLIGLSGTIGEAQERQEVRHLYNVDLFDVPPHVPSQLKILPPCLCLHETDYYMKLLQRIHARLKEGHPTLILLHTIADTLKLSEKLRNAKVDHQLLNAVQQEEEAYLLTKAGQEKAVTIATNAAGRGTDILLSAGGQRAGGLHVIFGFCPENLRVERQGQGRAGRQGQPGTCEIIAWIGSPSVQSLLHLTDDDISPDWNTLMRLRASKVRQLSIYRTARSERSIVLYDILSDFLAARRKAEKALNSDPVKQSMYRHILSGSWSQFYEEMENSPFGRDERNRLLDAYKSFKESVLLNLNPSQK